MNNSYSLYKFTRAKNGYILERKDFTDGVADGEVETIVGTDGDDEHETFAQFLWDITNTWGPSDSKYSPKRIHTRIEPGNDTDGMSFDEEWQAQCIVDEKKDTESWAEYGKRIYKDLAEKIQLSKAFKKSNDYRD